VEGNHGLCFLVVRDLGKQKWNWQMKKRSFALAICASLVCSPAGAKVFVGVLWPMFGPMAAPGLAQLVAELRAMPDVEVRTYLHQSWPSLVQEINSQPPGTRTVVVGYSLGANSSVFVANKAKYVDLIVALQPSMFSWNPSITGNVGRMVEIYNPNRWMTFGGMGSTNWSAQTSSTLPTMTRIQERNSIRNFTALSKKK
jgi:hypothetical protein